MSHDNSDNDRLPDPFEHRDDEPTDRNSVVFGQVGTGKTDQLATELTRRVADDTESVKCTDPKGREGKENGG